MSPDANLYADKIDLSSYCDGDACSLCKVDSFEELVERIRSGATAGAVCPHWPRWRVEAFELAAKAGEVMPAVPSLQFPRPVPPGLLELNDPGPAAPVLATGNSEFTQEVMLALVSLTLSPLKLLTIDCLGHTVDMAVVFKEWAAERVVAALEENGLASDIDPPRVILPGLTRATLPGLESYKKARFETGPVCAAEIPLYLGEEWIPASDRGQT